MNLPSLIQQIRESMARGHLQNEAAVSQGAVLPILNALAWIFHKQWRRTF